MANPSADYPSALHTNTDTSGFGSTALGSTTPTHTNLEGKQEEEITATQTKIGTGSSTPTSATYLRGDGTGTSAWAALSLVDDTSPQLGGDLDTNGNNITIDDAHGLLDDSDNEYLLFSKTASAVNQLTITNAATGNGPTLAATGDDTNIDFNIDPKGTGNVVIDGLRYPEADGSADQYIKTDGGGNLTFGTPAGAGDMLASTYDAAGVSEQLVGLTASQTLTNKTLTQPALTLTQSATPTPTAEGVIEWDTDGNQIKIGDGSGTKTFSDDAGLSITESQISDLGTYLENVVEDTTPQLGGALDGQGHDLNNLGVAFLTEQAAAEADVAGKGQIWVKTVTPNQLWFTDDAGTDFQLASLAATETFTNKTIDADNNTISNIALGAEATGDLGDLSNVGVDTMTNRNVLVADGDSWESRALVEADVSDLGTYLTDVVSDTTPQLGGMLDVNGNSLGDGTLELLSFSETGSAVNEFTIANAATGNAPVLSATGGDTNIGITLTPKGTGNVTLGTMVFDADQTIGAGQDNYVLTYDNGGGVISLEAAGAGGGQTTWDAVVAASGGDFTTVYDAINDGDKKIAVISDTTENGNWDISTGGYEIVGFGQPTITMGAYTIQQNNEISDTGNITATKGSANVSGSGTSFTSELTVGDRLFIGQPPDQRGFVTVQSITNDTALVLEEEFGYETESASGIWDGYSPVDPSLVRGLKFTGASGSRIFLISGGNDIHIENCTFDDCTTGESIIRLGPAENIWVENCLYQNDQDVFVYISSKIVSGVFIRNNVIRDITHDYIFYLSNCSNVTVEGNDIDHCHDDSTNYPNIFLTGVPADINIRNNRFIYSYGSIGVAGYKVVIEGNRFIGGERNIQWKSGGADILIKDNVFKGCNLPMRAESFSGTLDGVEVVNNHFYDCDGDQIDIDASGVENVKINGNVIRDIGAEGSGIAIANIGTDAMIVGNYIDGNDKDNYCIYVQNPNTLIANNYLRDGNDASYASGIEIVSTANNCHIVGNMITDCETGIEISGDECVVSNNYIKNSDGYAVKIAASADETHVLGNFFDNNTSGGVDDSGSNSITTSADWDNITMA